MSVCLGVHMAGVYEDQKTDRQTALRRWFLSCHFSVGCGDGMHATRLSWRVLYPLTHLASFAIVLLSVILKVLCGPSLSPVTEFLTILNRVCSSFEGENIPENTRTTQYFY